jgi:hypothetical protein
MGLRPISEAVDRVVRRVRETRRGPDPGHLGPLLTALALCLAVVLISVVLTGTP